MEHSYTGMPGQRSLRKRMAPAAGVTTATHYRWERELLTGVRKNGAPPSTTVTFAELPVPKQVSRNVAERCATLHIDSTSLDIYSGCDAEQMKMLVELLRLC